MINQLAQRPASRRRSNIRPVTGRASQANEKLSNEFFENGKKHMVKKQYQQALKHYMNATIHNPYNFKALCNLGSIYKMLGKFSEARDCYNKAIFCNPNDYICLYNLGNLERGCGNDQQAISMYNKVINMKQLQNIDVGSLYYDSLINQGICFKNLQLYDQAILSNQKAIQISPQDQSAYFNKAMCLLKKIYTLLKSNFSSVQKRLCQQAGPIFKKVLQISPNNFTAKMALIQLKYLQNCNQETLKTAIAQFQTLFKTAPEFDKTQIKFKIKYCQNQLKNIEVRKIIPPPKQDIVQFKKQNNNQYDSQKKTQQKSQQKPQPKASQKALDSIKPKPQSSSQPPQSVPQPRQRPPSSQKQKLKKVSQSKQSLIRPHTPQNLAQKYSPQVQQYLKEGKSIRQIVDLYIEKKCYDQAFELARSLPDGIQKYELEIIINYMECADSGNEKYLESAVAIYHQFILKDDINKPITKQLCSTKGHEYIATMLNVFGSYEQAAKHYQVLLQIMHDEKFSKTKKQENDEKIKQIHAQLGVCYAQKGLIDKAIMQYETSLKMQPDNYFLMTVLCGLLIQNKRSNEAKKYYEDFLKKNDGQNMADKVPYIDSLLNLSICARQTPQQQSAIQKAISAIQKFFPTYSAIQSQLQQQAVLGLYLRQAQLLQKQIQQISPQSQDRRQLYSKMLDTYLTCLQFQNCPDRQAISINSGILFYINGCYVNALNFYRTVLVNRNAIANNLGLTLLHLQEYERGVSCLGYAAETNPKNVVYATNFQIGKWMCGLSDNSYIEKYDCKCEGMHDQREAFGLWMLDQLTKSIQRQQIAVQIKLSEKSISEQIKNIITKLIKKSQSKQSLSQATSNKLTIITKSFDKHMVEHHSHSEPSNGQPASPLLSPQLLSLCNKKYQSQAQTQKSLSKLLDQLQKLPYLFNSNTIVQAALCLFLVRNEGAKIKDLFRRVLKARGLYADHIENLESNQYKGIGFVGKKVQITGPIQQIKFKFVHNAVRDAECVIENLSQYLMENIQQAYYSKPNKIASPLTRTYRLPHCQDLSSCIRCMISSSNLYSSLFKKSIQSNLTSPSSTLISSFPQTLQSFTQQCLQSANNLVSTNSQTKLPQLTITLSNNEPFVIRTQHESYADIEEYLERIDTSFKGKISNKGGKRDSGIVEARVNGLVVLEMWWGTVRYVHRFAHWLAKREVNYGVDAAMLLGDEFDNLIQLPLAV